MKFDYIIFIWSLSVILILNCGGNVSPLDSQYSKIMPLELNNTWIFKNISNGDITEIKVIDKWNYSKHKMYKLSSGSFTQSITNLYYIDDDLYGQLNDTTDIIVFKKDGARFFTGITYSDYENIKVPAGSFPAIKVKITGHTGHSRFGSTKWYSFGIGPVKREDYYINWKGEKTETIYVLESFSLN